MLLNIIKTILNICKYKIMKSKVTIKPLCNQLYIYNDTFLGRYLDHLSCKCHVTIDIMTTLIA